MSALASLAALPGLSTSQRAAISGLETAISDVRLRSPAPQPATGLAACGGIAGRFGSCDNNGDTGGVLGFVAFAAALAGGVLVAPAALELFGVAGAFGAAGGAVTEDDLATESNLETVTQHLDNIGALGDHPPNLAMLGRIEEAIASGRDLTPGEVNFMTHELTEANLMSNGVGQDLAHELAGQTHPTFGNYDPEVIKQFPEYFNSNWRAFWNIP